MSDTDTTEGITTEPDLDRVSGVWAAGHADRGDGPVLWSWRNVAQVDEKFPGVNSRRMWASEGHAPREFDKLRERYGPLFTTRAAALAYLEDKARTAAEWMAPAPGELTASAQAMRESDRLELARALGQPADSPVTWRQALLAVASLVAQHQRDDEDRRWEDTEQGAAWIPGQSEVDPMHQALADGLQALVAEIVGVWVNGKSRMIDHDLRRVLDQLTGAAKLMGWVEL